MSTSRFNLCLRVFTLLGVSLCGSAIALAQAGLDPISSPGPFGYQATLPVHGLVVIEGDVSLIAGIGVVHVLERSHDADSWTETTQLTPSGGDAGFGRSLAFDGTTAIVGADGAAYVYRRNRNEPGRWREMARLQPPNGVAGFGVAVAVDRDTVLVSGGNAVYVFARTEDSGWIEAATLTSPELTVTGFARALDVSGNTAVVVGAKVGALLSSVFVYERSAPGARDWHLVGHLPQRSGFLWLNSARIDKDTIVVAGGDGPGYAAVFERDSAGGETWRQAAFYQTGGAGSVGAVDISGDLIVLAEFVGNSQLDILARNQGGYHAWGAVSRFRSRPYLAPLTVAVDADTVMFAFGPALGTTFVYTSDQDGDGLRDAVDPCVRDPLNNVEGRCQRATWAYPVLDDLVQRTTVSTARPKSNRQVITMTITNTSSIAIRNPFLEVTDIDSHSELLNADGTLGGVGASLSPDVGDGVLSPGESVTVSFEVAVRPASSDPVFAVTFKGELAQSAN